MGEGQRCVKRLGLDYQGGSGCMGHAGGCGREMGVSQRRSVKVRIGSAARREWSSMQGGVRAGSQSVSRVHGEGH